MFGPVFHARRAVVQANQLANNQLKPIVHLSFQIRKTALDATFEIGDVVLERSQPRVQRRKPGVELHALIKTPTRTAMVAQPDS
jgi:hypothetical protein